MAGDDLMGGPGADAALLAAIFSGVCCVALLLDMGARYVLLPRRRGQATAAVTVAKDDKKEKSTSSSTSSSSNGLRVVRETETTVTTTEQARTDAVDGRVVRETETTVTETTDGGRVTQRTTGGGGGGEKEVVEEVIETKISQSQSALPRKGAGSSITYLSEEPDVAHAHYSHYPVGPVIQDSVRRVSTAFDKTKTLSKACEEKLAELRSLKELCATLSRQIEEKTLSLLQTEAVKSDCADSKLLKQQSLDCVSAVREEWGSLRSMLYCLDVHMRNAADYHQFYHEVDEYEQCVDSVTKSLYTEFDKDKATLGQDSLAQTRSQIKDGMETLQFWEPRLHELTRRSRDIVPLQLRSGTEEECLVTSLCTVNTAQGVIDEGQQLTLTDNKSDANMWKAKTTSGDDVTVPALCCLIPAPDHEATDAISRLKIKLCVAMTLSMKALGNKLIWTDNELYKKWLTDKSLQSVTAQQKKETLESLETLVTSLEKYWSNSPEYAALKETVTKLKTAVEKAEGGDDPSVAEEFFHDIQESQDVLGAYDELWSKWEVFRVLVESASHPEFMLMSDKLDAMKVVSPTAFLEHWHPDFDVEALENIEETKVQRLVGVEVKRERSRAVATDYTAASSELRETFTIQSVLNPRTNRQISIEAAVDRGIINRKTGVYYNTITRESIPIPVAMEQGLIVVASSKKRQTREKVSSMGILKITITRETKPYTIKGVVDPVSYKVLTIDEAIARGVYDQDENDYVNLQTGARTRVADAIDMGSILVEFDASAESASSEPEVVTQTYAIHAVKDVKNARRVTFHDAVRAGIVIPETGAYRDNLTGEEMYIAEAMKKGLVRAELVKDKDLENGEPMEVNFHKFERSQSFS